MIPFTKSGIVWLDEWQSLQSVWTCSLHANCDGEADTVLYNSCNTDRHPASYMVVQ